MKAASHWPLHAFLTSQAMAPTWSFLLTLTAGKPWMNTPSLWDSLPGSSCSIWSALPGKFTPSMKLMESALLIMWSFERPSRDPDHTWVKHTRGTVKAWSAKSNGSDIRLLGISSRLYPEGRGQTVLLRPVSLARIGKYWRLCLPQSKCTSSPVMGFHHLLASKCWRRWLFS